MDRYHINVACLLSWEAPRDEYNPNFISKTPSSVGQCGPIPFSRCLSFYETCPERFILGYAPDPRRPEAIDLLESAIELYNVRVYGELKLRMMYDNPDALRMFRFCGEKRLPVVVHISYEKVTGVNYPRPSWWYGGGIECFERVLQRCPGTIFIGHAQGFWAHLSGDDQYESTAYPEGPVLPGGKLIDLLREYPNLYCDVSAGSGCKALHRDPGFSRDFLIEFQDRVLYGRDGFGNQHQELLNSLKLPQEVLEKIYSGNALKLMNGSGL